MKRFFYCFIAILAISCSQKDSINLEWVDNLPGDYSFAEKWDYNDNIFRNQFGHLVCDGICPEKLENMRDEEGKIYEDSLHKYYQLVDTSHIYHTIECEAQCYEWAGTNNIITIPTGKNGIKAYTLCNPSTHSSLKLNITGNRCIAAIELSSIASSGHQIFPCNGGYIKIDKKLWNEGILKAEFDLSFENILQPQDSLWWKGKIYKRIDEN